MESQSYSPEKISEEECTVFLLPTLRGEAELSAQIAAKRELLKHVPENLDFLNQIPQEIMDGFLQEIRKELNEAYFDFKDRLNDIASAPETRKQVEQEFGGTLLTSNMAEASSKGVSEALKQQFKKTTSDIICLSNSHVTTYFEIEEALAETTEKQGGLAVMVFDNHPDVFYNPKEERRVSEANVFLALAGNGLINGAVLIGPQSEAHVVPKANDLMNDALKKQLPEAEDQIFFIGIDTRSLQKQAEETGESTQDSLQRQITNMVDVLRKDGIKNIVFSIDIDFLNSGRIGYTGFQYTPVELLSMLAEMDFSEMDPTKLSKTDVDDLFLDMIVGLKNIYKRYDEGMPEEELQEYIDNEVWMNPLSANLRSGSYDPKTLTMGDVGRSIDQIVKECRMSGIEVGIKLKSGGRFIGDVVGFEGKDYRGMTAKATKALTERLAKAASSN